MRHIGNSILALCIVLAAWVSGTAIAQTNVAFADPNLEAAVRSALDRPYGSLNGDDLQGLVFLSAYDANISELTGLEWATNLAVLYLGKNTIEDLAPLQNLTRLTSLFLFNNQVRDLSPLAGLTNLSYLELRHNPVTNYETCLSGLSNLTSLYLGDNSICNVHFLQPLSRLTCLNLDHNSVGNVAPLTVLTNLSSLDLSYNPLTNFDAVSAFSNLTSLHLSGDCISNLAFLANLTGLDSLVLYSNSVSDLSPLVGLTNLSALNLDDNRIRDLAPLTSLRSLTRLDVEKNRLTDISVLRNLPGLTWVDLRWNLLDLSATSEVMAVISDLQQVTVDYLPQDQPPIITAPSFWPIAAGGISFINFQIVDDVTPSDQVLVTADSSETGLLANGSLSLGGTNSSRTLGITPAANQTGTATITLRVTDGAGLSNTAAVQVAVVAPQLVVIPDTNLEAVVRSALGTAAGDLSNVDLLRLTQLFAYNANISNLEGLEWATNLTILDLGGNFITDLGALRDLSGLQSLYFCNNLIIDPSLLAGLTNLSYLDLGANPITNFEPCQSGLIHLSELCLEGTSITNIIFLQNMTGLRYLDLSNNRIRDLSPLAGLTNLTDLSVQQNLLTDLAPLNELEHLSHVDVSWNLLELSPESIALSQIEGLLARGITVVYESQRESIWLETPTQVLDGLQLVVHGPTDLQLELQSSTDLTNWTGVTVISNAVGSVSYTDELTPNQAFRFYRAKLAP